MTISLPLQKQPKSVCILRLSAIGDVMHVLPIIHNLQQYWPQTKITWIIGRTEAQLVTGLQGVEFIIFDKSKGVKVYLELYRQLQTRQFDVLLHMQAALRASLASLLVKSSIKVGFDRARAIDMQWLFTNHRIAAVERQHVLDGFFEFIGILGVTGRELKWPMVIPSESAAIVNDYFDERSLLVINPCTSQRRRNWRDWYPPYYAQVIDYAIANYDLQIALTGADVEREHVMANAILDKVSQKNKTQVTNLVGKTNLKSLAAVLQRANVVIAPDTGPAHIANGLGTPVIGLYATSNPKRTGPYFSQWTINKYPQALEMQGLDEKQVKWGHRVRDPKALDLITVEDVIQQLNKLLNR